MKRIKQCFNKISYANSSLNTFKENSKEINSENEKVLNFVLKWSTFIIGAVTVCSIIRQQFVLLGKIHITFFVLLVVLNIIADIFKKRTNKQTKILFYSFISLIYSLGIVIGVFANKNLTATMFLVFMICVPILFISPPYKLMLHQGLFIIIFNICSYVVQPADIFELNFLNSSTTFIITSLVTYYIVSIRIGWIISKKALANKVYFDDLTSLHNRRAINEHMVEITDCFSDKNKNLAFIMIDIDNFKIYNDTFGHLKGDSCLVEIGSILSQVEEKYNLFSSRYGGEEFLIVLIDKTLPEINNIAEEIRKEIFDKNIIFKNVPQGRMTVSIGVADKETTCAANYIELVDKADIALFRAKQTGKNKVCFSTKLND